MNKKTQKITFRVSEKMYEALKAGQEACDISSLSQYLCALMELQHSVRFTDIQNTDISWTKYIYVIHHAVSALVRNFEKSQSSPNHLYYFKAMFQGIENMIDSVINAESYNIDLELEANFIDAINIFFLWLDNNKITEYNVKKLADRLKQNLKWNS